MLIMRGVNVFPSQVEEALLCIDGLEPHCQIVVDQDKHLDELKVWVEVSADIFHGEKGLLGSLETRVRAELRSLLGISTKVRLVEPVTLGRSESKAKRVTDRRGLGSKDAS